MPQKAHKPTDDQRRMVKAMTAFGIKQEEMCDVLGISLPTLHKYYRHEIDVGAAEANMKVANALYQQAVGGNVTAAIFWAKTRLGWRETVDVQHSGSVEVKKVERVIIDPANSNSARIRSAS